MTKVLIVEDDSDILSIIEEKLDILGFEITSCGNPNEISNSIESQRPDIILLDIKLPGKDGIEIAKELKGNPETKEIPIIAVSGNPDIGDTEMYTDVGNDRPCCRFPTNFEHDFCELQGSDFDGF